MMELAIYTKKRGVMELAPVDILKQDFAIKLFGFDKNEIRIFLKLVATAYEEVINENILLKKQLTAIENKEMEFTTKDDLKRFISTIELVKKRELEKAEQEAALIVREAQLKAEAMIKEAESEAEKIKIAISDLKNQHRSFEQKIREQIESYIKLLSSISEG